MAGETKPKYKLLGMHIKFQLGNDFEGSLADALRKLADHLDDPSIPDKSKETEFKMTETMKQSDIQLWEQFKKCDLKTKLLGRAGIDFFNWETKKWEHQDLGVNG